jgi:hypothetical protein
MIGGDRACRWRVACAATLGLAAALALSAHRHTVSLRSHAPVISACHNGITWVAAPPPATVGVTQACRTARRATFWVGLISLACGIAVVQWASLLRIVRIGGRCGY